LGLPPATIEWDGQTITPVAFSGNILKIQPDNYAQVTSFKHVPLYQHTELVLPDNWQHYRHFLNVPLPKFENLMQHALKQGYSMVIDMDLSEKGYGRQNPCAILIPEFMSADSLTETVRTALFENETTSDDHLQHLVGFAPADTTNKAVWYLIKDSLDWSYESNSGGYVYMREDYLKMKVLSFMVHREFLENEIIPKRH
jgi:bleomycin hydrolase